MATTERRCTSNCIKGIVAIDFGTEDIALAYCEITEQKQYHLMQCEGRYVAWNSKNKNNVLLTPDGKFIAFSSVALETYLNYDSDDSSSDSSSDDSSTDSSSDDDEYIDEVETNLRNRHSELLFCGYCRRTEIEITRVIPEEVMKLIYCYNPPYNAKISKKLVKRPMLFESIKTALYNENISDAIRCVDGRMCSTSTVFVAVFKCIKQTVFNFFRKHHIEIRDTTEIKWILTVPAIWSDLAKYKMEKWALKGGLINSTNDLRFVYESDCTLISCQYEAKNQVLDGERCIVIDAGAGIVDIGCYQMDGNHAREIYFPTGGLWGGNMVDLQFEQLLYEIFGSGAVSPFKLNYTPGYVKLIENFRKSKKNFYNKPNAKFHAVSLSFDFTLEMMDYYDEVDDFDVFIGNARPFGFEKDHLIMENDTLLISCEIWKKMFDEVIDPMIDHVENLVTAVNQIKDEDNKPNEVKYLYISGGFSSSKYFQHRIEQAFGINSLYGLRVAMPVKPHLSVIDGAIKLGYNPKYISGRILKYTYGISVDRREKNVDMSKLPKEYLDNFRRNTYFHPNTRKRIVKNLFSVIARKNSLVESHQCIEKNYKRFHKMEKRMKISLYYSTDMDPYVVGDKPLVSMIITFPEDYNELRCKVLFYFGGTKISAKVVFVDAYGFSQTIDALQLQFE